VAKQKRNSGLSNKAADKIWQDFMRQPAQITPEQCDAMEQGFQHRIVETGVARRMALASLARSGRELAEAIGRKAPREAAEAFAEAAAHIEDATDFYKAVTESMETAALRIKIALADRPDMSELLAAAKKNQSRAGQVGHA
jgi:hypothetical protein